MAAGPPAEKIPRFQEPESTVSPSIKNLLHEKLVVENGISYAEYKGVAPREYISHTENSVYFFSTKKKTHTHKRTKTALKTKYFNPLLYS